MDKNRILFVTSSTPKMYYFSGINFLESFIKHNSEYDLLYCTENFDLEEKYIKYQNIFTYDLENSEYLDKFIHKFKYLIPYNLGGKNKTMDSLIKEKKINIWNYKASLWFRKIASLEIALNFNNKYNTIIWIDIDTLILNNFDDYFLNNLFKDKKIFYFLGETRNKSDTGIESGFIGFKSKEGLRSLMKFLIFIFLVLSKNLKDGMMDIYLNIL